MSDMDALRDLLKTVTPLAASGLKTLPGLSGGAGVAAALGQRWTTKQRLIERLLQESDPRSALDLFESRTRDYLDRHPDKPVWRDRSGQEWNGPLVLQACEEVRDHLDSWDAEDDFTEEDDDHGSDGGDGED